MEVNEIRSRLSDLATNLIAQSQLEKSINSYKQALQYEKTRPSKKVEQFDSTHKDQFIYSKVGEKPVKPNKAMVILLPVYLKKKKEYDEALEIYNSAVQRATNKYFRTYEIERQALLDADNQERASAIEELTTKINSAEQKLASIVEAIEQEDIISAAFKTMPDVQLLIAIFYNQRADSIKEAINILCEDKHHQRMEELQEENIRLMQETKATAEEALRRSDEAFNKAIEALNRANDAYDRAEDAYREARSAD